VLGEKFEQPEMRTKEEAQNGGSHLGPTPFFGEERKQKICTNSSGKHLTAEEREKNGKRRYPATGLSKKKKKARKKRGWVQDGV